MLKSHSDIIDKFGSEKKYEIIKTLIEIAEENEIIYFEICKATALIFPKCLIESLKQFVNGPIKDGDEISKAEKILLKRIGLCISICLNGEQGATGAKYIAYTILKAISKKEED